MMAPPFENRIDELCRERGRSHADVARSIGMSQSEFSRFVTGQRALNQKQMSRIAAGIPCNPCELLPEWRQAITELAARSSDPSSARSDKTPPRHKASQTEYSIFVMAPVEMDVKTPSGMKVAHIRRSPDGSFDFEVFAGGGGAADAPSQTAGQSRLAKKLTQLT